MERRYARIKSFGTIGRKQIAMEWNKKTTETSMEEKWETLEVNIYIRHWEKTKEKERDF